SGIGSSCCSMGAAHPPPNWPCSIQLQSGSGQGHHCGRSTWCLPNGLPSVSPMQGWWWFVYTPLVPPRWPRLHRILTRQSILLRRRWTRGSSPRVTGGLTSSRHALATRFPPTGDGLYVMETFSLRESDRSVSLARWHVND